MLNPSPVARSGLVQAELLVPDEWDAVSLELPDGRRIGAQELSRKQANLFDETMLGREVESLFRRFHGREVFDHAWNGYRIDGRTLLMEVDNDADPAWLDVDGLAADVTAAMLAAPDDEWHVRIVARARRTLAASVPAPALGWTAARPVEGNADVEAPVRAEGSLARQRPAARLGRRRRHPRARRPPTGRSRGAWAGSSTAATSATRTTTARRRATRSWTPRARWRSRAPWPGRSSAASSCGARTTGRAGSPPTARRAPPTTEPTEVTMTVELRAGEPFARIGLAFENRSDDHRVRFHAPLPRRADASHAEGQFAVVERGLTAEGGYREEPLATFPAHGWVDAGGLAVLLDHIGEYEVTGDELALTLLRSTGLISRNANPYREDPAGPQMAIPNAQMRGRLEDRVRPAPP